jgi:hypothetical protein
MVILALLACLDEFPDRHADFDADGVPADEDCDDENAAVGAASLWYLDGDGDGYGGDSSLETCHPPPNYVTSDEDCDDAAAWNYPGNVEECDQYDNDCNGAIDDVTKLSPEANVGYPDVDGDNYGDMHSIESVSCDIRLPDHSDCDDLNAHVHPNAVEVCDDGFDTDCDLSCDDCCFEDLEKEGNTVRGSALALLSRAPYVPTPVGPTVLTGDLFAESARAFAAGSSKGGTVYAVPASAMPKGDDQIEIDVDNPTDLATIAVLRSPAADELFGASLATRENGAQLDLLIGAPGARQIGSLSTEGAVYVVPGPQLAGADVTLGEEDVAFYGDPGLTGQYFGSSLLTGFDFDGDENADVVVSGAGETLTTGAPAGAVSVFFEIPPGPTASTNTIVGSEESDAFGASLAAGDLNRDGFDDLLVGRTNGTTPEVCVFFGDEHRFDSMDSEDADLAFVSYANAANLGASLAIADFDGDDWPDVAAGASMPGAIGTQNATVRVFLNNGNFVPPTTEPEVIGLDSTDLTFVGTDRDFTGTALVARDFDGDRIDDLLIGSPGVSGGGITYLLRMPQTGGVGPEDTSTSWSMGTGGQGGDLGAGLGADDFDSDGWTDVLLAAPRLPAVYVYKNRGVQ